MKRLPYATTVVHVRKEFLSLAPMSPIAIVQRCLYPAGLATDYRNIGPWIHVLLTICGQMYVQEENGDELSLLSGTMTFVPLDCTFRWRTEKDTDIFECLIPDGLNFKSHRSLATLFGPNQKHIDSWNLGAELVEYVKGRLALAKLSGMKDVLHSLTAFHIMEAAAILNERRNSNASQPRACSTLSICIGYIENNLTRQLSLKELSDESRMSVSSLSELFRKKFNESPMQYVSRRRAEVATSLLNEGSLSVGEIAQRLGFNSISYFTRFFKRQTGRLPSSLAVR